MKFDNLGCLVMEKDGYPGDIGDSCAETGRYAVLTYPLTTKTELSRFITVDGFVRHPDAPACAPGSGENWREPDFTSDQALPLVMALKLEDRLLSAFVCQKLKNMGWGTAPTKPCAPGVYFAANDQLQALGLTTLIQKAIFALPYRWKDSGGFEKSEGSTADWLNYVITILYLKRRRVTWPWWFLDRERALKNIRSYYASQPNSAWLVSLYEAALGF